MIQIDEVHAKLLHGLTLAQKPKRILELGYGIGHATDAIYSAPEFNQQPYTYTLVDNWSDYSDPAQVTEKYNNKINVVTSNERDFVFSCQSQFDLIMSDADHHSTDQWFEYVYDALLADDGILCYHDVMLTSMFPNLYRIYEQCRALNLRYKVFDKDSLPNEMCFRGFLVIFK